MITHTTPLSLTVDIDMAQNPLFGHMGEGKYVDGSQTSSSYRDSDYGTDPGTTDPSREVRYKLLLHAHVQGVSNRFCPSVCLSVCLWTQKSSDLKI